MDNERVSYVNLAASFTIFPLSDGYVALREMSISSSSWTVSVSGSVKRFIEHLEMCGMKMCDCLWLGNLSIDVRIVQFLKPFLVSLICSFLQFNYKKRNQTAVREEVVQIANYVDSVSFPAYFKINATNASNYITIWWLLRGLVMSPLDLFVLLSLRCTLLWISVLCWWDWRSGLRRTSSILMAVLERCWAALLNGERKSWFTVVAMTAHSSSCMSFLSNDRWQLMEVSGEHLYYKTFVCKNITQREHLEREQGKWLNTETWCTP